MNVSPWSRISFGSVGVAGICLALFASSCAIPQRKVKILEINEKESSVVAYPADLRGAYVQKDRSLRFCAEPAPDVALDSLEKITANLKGTLPQGQAVEGSLATEFATKVVQLAGRTQLVLVAREMLYRACELSLNNTVDTPTVTLLYDKAAKLIEALARADEDRARAQLADSAAALKAAGVSIDAILK